MTKGKLYDLPQEVTRDSVESGEYVQDIQGILNEAKKDLKNFIIIEAKQRFHTDNPDEFPSQSMGNWEEVYLNAYRVWFKKWFGKTCKEEKA